jgi:hypothetical protein
MMHTKRVIFVALPLLFVPLVYGFSSTPDACAAPNVAPTGAQCWTYPLSDSPGNYVTTCCWTEVDAEGIEIEYCQHCDYNPSTGTHSGCGEAHPIGAQQPTPTPPTFGRLPPGVLDDLPTLEQVPATPPPLFGQNGANAPPIGGVEQPPNATPPPTPGSGGNVPTEGGSAEQPPAAQDDQDGNAEGGLPTIKNKENIPLDNEITEQPDDDGQEDSSEGAETAGPLT